MTVHHGRMTVRVTVASGQAIALMIVKMVVLVVFVLMFVRGGQMFVRMRVALQKEQANAGCEQ